MATPSQPTSFWNELKEARLIAHQLVQLVALVPRGLFPEDPGDGQSNLGWDDNLGLVSLPFGPGRIQAALRIRDLSVVFLTHEEVIEEKSVLGETMADLFDWEREVISGHGLPVDRLSLELPYRTGYAWPAPEPITSSPVSGLEALSGYFSQAFTLINRFKQDLENTSEVRCWPHHFDAATLMDLGTTKGTGIAKSIGVGFSPGDSKLDGPYYYISPWPYDSVDLESLPSYAGPGIWSTDDWFGAYLPAAEFESHPEQARARHILEFFDQAANYSRMILDR